MQCSRFTSAINRLVLLIRKGSTLILGKRAEVNDILRDIKSCTAEKNLQRGKNLHAQARKNGTISDVYVVNAFINMYRKCGSMACAHALFDSTPNPDVVSWTNLIFGYAGNGNGVVALELFSKMKEAGFKPNFVTYIGAIKACTSLAASGDKSLCHERGREIHSEVGCHLTVYLQNTLLDMYSKCGSMSEAHDVFDGIAAPDVVCWTNLILGYADNGKESVALEFFYRMKQSGCEPDSVTYIAVIKACTSLASTCGKESCLARGREIHSAIGHRMNHYLQNSLIRMYSKHGSMIEARCVFDGMPMANVVSWNALLLGYAENGEGQTALDLFTKMKVSPDSGTYVAIIKACTSLAVNEDAIVKWCCLEKGRKIHLEVGNHLNRVLQNTLIDMYSKYGSMVEARSVFDSIEKPDVVSWTALILGYVENGEEHVAVDLFILMKAGGCKPDSVTYVSLLKACSALALSGDGNMKLDCLERGRKIHSEIEGKLDRNLESILIDMYSNCGSMFEARTVFNSIQDPDVVCWNALLLGYAESGEGYVVLELLRKLKSAGVSPTSVTYIAVLKSCGVIGALVLGRKFHSEIKEYTCNVVTCLVDFYANCGSIEEAREVFDMHPRTRSVSTWNALLVGYGRFVDTAVVFEIFDAMQDEGFRPNSISFLCVLLCCSHAGLVEKAREYFDSMPVRYGINPTIVHYTCMVDVLGRGNQLNEAIRVMRKMPYNLNAVVWTTLLGACCKWRNVEIGRVAFQSLANMGKRTASSYVLMAHMCSENGDQVSTGTE